MSDGGQRFVRALEPELPAARLTAGEIRENSMR